MTSHKLNLAQIEQAIVPSALKAGAIPPYQPLRRAADVMPPTASVARDCGKGGPRPTPSFPPLPSVARRASGSMTPPGGVLAPHPRARGGTRAFYSPVGERFDFLKTYPGSEDREMRGPSDGGRGQEIAHGR